MTVLHHVGITVSDLHAATAFYVAATDGEAVGPLLKRGVAVERATGHPGAEISLMFITPASGGTVIELAHYGGVPANPTDPDTGRAGAAHPAITVPDLDAALARLGTLGHAPLSEPMVATAGPLDGYRYVYVLGPDDVRVELLQRPGDHAASSRAS